MKPMTQSKIYTTIKNFQTAKKKSFAMLLDPDKLDETTLQNRIDAINANKIDFVFVGGSLISSDNLNYVLEQLKTKTFAPKIIFPGNGLHINCDADGILLLSLISGRNPEYLIGQHVISAPMLKRSGLELLSTGYMLIDGGTATTVSYISNTTPLPNNKPDIASCTALAGEMLGLKLIYLDAGSGAKNPVSEEIIRAVRKTIEGPIIVGGGINSLQKAQNALSAGADIIVVGNAIEDNPNFISDIAQMVQSFNFSMA
jgi:phosphoglycerol geranylgeranyltransferase